MTANPAPVPAELVGTVAGNVHNYLTTTDVLRRVVRGGDLAKQFYDTVADARQVAAGTLVSGAAAGIADQLVPGELIAKAAVGALEAVEIALGPATTQLRTAIIGVGVVAAPALLITGKADDLWRFQQQVGDVHDAFKAASDEWQERIGEIGRAIEQLPEVLLELRPYVESCFFSDAMIESTYDALATCRNLADRSYLSSGEAARHLEDHSAAAIDALGDRAADLGVDLGTAAASVEQMVA